MGADGCRSRVLSSRMTSSYTKRSPSPYSLISIIVRTIRGGINLRTFIFKNNPALHILITPRGVLVLISRFYRPLHTYWHIWLCTNSALNWTLLMRLWSVSVFRSVIKLKENFLVLEDSRFNARLCSTKLPSVSRIPIMNAEGILYKLHRHLNTTYYQSEFENCKAVTIYKLAISPWPFRPVISPIILKRLQSSESAVTISICFRIMLIPPAAYSGSVFFYSVKSESRSRWPRGLRCASGAARLLGLWVRNPQGAWMSVSCECCVLSGRSLCDGPITLPEESYRVCVCAGVCVLQCDLVQQ
jgi:hypothetical protein